MRSALKEFQLRRFKRFPGGWVFVGPQKNPGVSRGFLSEGGDWCEECTEGVSAPGVQMFSKGLGFCWSPKKTRGFPGGFCLKLGVGVRSALKEFEVLEFKDILVRVKILS